MLFQACKLDNETIIESDTPPLISGISVTPALISIDQISPIVDPEEIVDTTIIVSVFTDNAAGIQDLVYEVISPSGIVLSQNNQLHNNGKDSDISAGDNIFTAAANISFKKKEVGVFEVRITATSNNGVVTRSLSALIVDNPLLKKPQISSLIVPDTAFIPTSQDSVFVSFSVKAFDPQGLNDITTVTASIFTNEGDPVKSILLYDDGGINPVPPYALSSGDAIAGDSIYSNKIAFSKKQVDNYFVIVIAKDKDEATSNSLSEAFSIRNEVNGAPLVFGIEMPDSVSVPTGSDTNFVKIAITVDDPQGLDDIFAVYFTSFRPDNSVVGTYKMYDDGSHGVHEIFLNYFATSGDDLADDATFTVTIPIVAGTATNTYREFVFQAQDRGGRVSTTLSKQIFLK